MWELEGEDIVEVETTASKTTPRPADATTPAQGRTLLVAATGGHLCELVEWSGRLHPVEAKPLWWVPESEQSRHLLHGHDVVYAPPVEPRGLRDLPRAAAAAHCVFRDHDIDCVVSTGSGIALAAFVPARLRGIACHYIESAARVDGPSLSGRLAQRLPGVELYTQHSWVSPGRWRLSGSVFDGFRSRPRERRSPGPLRVVVTVGTMRFPFARLLDRLVQVLPAGADVLWQTGMTTVKAGSWDQRSRVPPDELDAAMRKADVVVAHAGVGSALTALQAGAFPILVPRRAAHGEHVDDHQQQIGYALAARSLAVCVEPKELSESLIAQASRVTVERHTAATGRITISRRRRW